MWFVLSKYVDNIDSHAPYGPFVLKGLGKGDIGVGQRRIKGQVKRRLAAVVPIVVRHAGRKNDEGTGAAVVRLAIDFDAHCAPQNIKDLINGMDVQAAR